MCILHKIWMCIVGIILLALSYNLLAVLKKEEKELSESGSKMSEMSDTLKNDYKRSISINRKSAIGAIIIGIYFLLAYIVNIIDKCL